MNTKHVKLVVFVPKTHASLVRAALGNAGAGKIGDYSHCTFSMIGKGRFIPLNGAEPALGKKGKLSYVNEERIETICPRKDIARILKKVRRVHPYETMVVDVYPLLDVLQATK